MVVPACGGSPVNRGPTPGAPASTSPSVFSRPWRWIDEQGQSVALEQYSGAPFVLTAIYTSCTVRCPMTIEKLRSVDEAFRRRQRLVPIVLVTLDPHVDTPERLGRFKQSHRLPDHWHLLHGSDLDTRALGRYLAVHAAVDDGHIDHDVRISFFHSDGQLARSFEGWAFDADDGLGVR